MDRLLRDICNKFESIWNTLPEEKRQDKGSLQLTQEQQTAVIEVIRQYVKPEQGIPIEKTILANISTNPHVTRLALNAIQNKEEFKDLKQELSFTVLEDLQNKLLGSKDSDEETVVLENWLETYEDHFDAQTIGSMDTDTLFHLVEILAKFQNQDNLHSIIQSLPRNARKYLDILRKAGSNTPDVTLFKDNFNNKEVHIALAHFISYKKCQISKLGFSKEQLLQIAPYLRYGDFRNLDENLIYKLLGCSQKINHLLINNYRIVSIKADLPNCHTLHCSGCEALQELPDLPKCHTLHCSDCKALHKLPDLPNCQTFHCSGCNALEKLPELPNCQTFHCNGCNALKKLPDLPKCHTLHCDGCKSLEELPDLPKCHTLHCNWCTVLKELPDLPECRTLYCSWCTLLKKLPDLPKCHTLYCTSCLTLEKLPNLPKCHTLNCSRCKVLRELPDLPNCQTLSCDCCEALEELSDLLNCQTLNCYGCATLKELPNLPKCQTLRCGFCTALQTLPRGLPACRDFNCEECPLVTQLPEVPADCNVYTGQNQQLAFAQMQVDVEKLSSDPKSLLLALGRSFLLNKKAFPNIIYYSEGKPSEAVDIGGVRRDFVTRLLREIFKRENPTHLNIQENGWPEKMCDQETIDCYRTLGKLFALCYPSDSPFKPGTIFPESVYHAIAMAKDPGNFSDEELISCYLLLKGVPLEVLKVIQESDISTIEDKTIHFASYLLDPDWDKNFQEIDPREFFNKPENKRKLQATLLENAMREPSLNAISWIAKEMKNSLGNNEWDNFRIDLRRMEKIQGVVSQKEVIEALSWVKGEVVEDKQHEETMTFMENWIRSADNEQLRSFIFAVTGNNAISEEIKIELQTYNRGPNQLPSAHTCLFSLELSAEYSDQQTFDQIMKMFLEYACRGFDSA